MRIPVTPLKNVQSVRAMFISMLNNEELNGDGMLEIINASFIADEASIFGKPNADYIHMELEWYKSQSLNIYDMSPEDHSKIPQIWKNIADNNGNINSNYGWCIFSYDNYEQFKMCIKALERDEFSRQAIMIYTRPSIQIEKEFNNKRDFICTNTVQIYIRYIDGIQMLIYIVNMRSNDAIFGYKNDKAWHDYVFDLAHQELIKLYPKLSKGPMIWNANSLHVYPRHLQLVKA